MTRLRDDASHRRQLKELMTEDVGVLKTNACRSAVCLVSALVVSPTMHPLVTLFVGCWIAVSTGWTSKPSNIEYAVVIDAGSTGSRVRVYAWHQRTTPNGRLPRFNMTSNYKVKPGISSFANNIDGIAEHIGDLVSHAKGSVPQGMTDTTPIYLMATAGMRLLLEGKSNDVMSKIHILLSDKRVNPFRYKRIQCRVLSGEEEGAFGWLSVNYLSNFFQVDGGPFTSGTSSPTDKELNPNGWGIVELGGASLQIAFIPPGSILANKFPVKVLGTYYPLYVHSYLGFGQQQVNGKATDHLFATAVRVHVIDEQSGDVEVIFNPCMLTGDTKTQVISNTSIEFRGTGDPPKCRTIFRSILGHAECSPRPCGLGAVYQPTIPSDKTFYELSAFAYTLKAIGLLDDDQSPTHTIGDIIDATERYCNKTIEEQRQETGQDVEYLSTDCTVGVYMEVLFKEIYRFDTSATFRSGFSINGGEPEWTLGAIIYEYGRRDQACISPTPKPTPKVGAVSGVAGSANLSAAIVMCTLLLLHRLCTIR